ncbi:hypothetical protein [Paracoccus albus]|uniref:hypothetical protein n=1 Tax=Paracoccus albus TaxID=3017784 RepID=UPI0022F10775|nr:hypothetical protein [Paracoccus albus]WBU59129.1 hypothetical protein PAF20_09990 [Paracoccus albus]
MNQSPFRQTDEKARQIARELIGKMTHAVLSAVDQTSAYPFISRISAQCDADGSPLAFLRQIAPTTRLLENNPRGAMLIEGSGSKDGAMGNARLQLQFVGRRMPNSDSNHMIRAQKWMQRDQKARAFIHLPDFNFWRLEPQAAVLIVNYGQIYNLRPADMKTTPG